ncbi:E3 ubiquitin-protein ligase APD1-like [Brassica napus]|nr:E3 ubiquitin-protein ligase APD1-like [Brassica napus]
MFLIFLILKFLSDCDMEDDMETLPVVAGEEVTGWTPLVNETSEVTGKGDLERASFSSADDVDYSTLCVICFEERRNCFFVPCGHSATCRGCAEKIMSEENKVCPICRRVIRKAKRLVLKC